MGRSSAGPYGAMRVYTLTGECAKMARPENIVRDPEVLGGTPVFRGTRVPFQSLLDYIEHGQTLDEFLDDFPTVSRQAAVSVLEEAKSLLVEQLG